MNGRYHLVTQFGRVFIATDDLREAYDEITYTAKVAHAPLYVRDTLTGHTVRVEPSGTVTSVQE